MQSDRRPEQLLENLTDPQREAVTHAQGPLLVLAGPGSGKTRVITHRAAYLACTVTQPRHILAITFTNKAANEMAERMHRLGAGRVTCSTFHSFCARLLRVHGQRVGLGPNFSIYDDSDQSAAVKQAIELVGQSTEQFTPGNVLDAIGKAKNEMIDAEQYAAEAVGWEQRQIAPVYAAYEQVLAEQNAADFDDLLIKTARLLGDNPDIREQLEAQYRYVLVDEYQDTNHAQYLIARGLCLQHENLCVTGDPDQSIYGWRGANIHNILQFEEDFADAKVVHLEQNYRSTPQILAAADAVIARNRKRKKKKLWTGNGDGEPVRVAECEDAHAEATFIATEIQRHLDGGGRYNDVAIFYRVNALSRNLEAALRTHQIPYQVARGVAFFQRREIKDTLAYLRLLANPQDQVSLLRIINLPARGIGEVTVQRVLQHAAGTGRTALEVLQTPEQIPGIGRAATPLMEFARLMNDLRRIAGNATVTAGAGLTEPGSDSAAVGLTPAEGMLFPADPGEVVEPAPTHLQELVEQTIRQSGLVAMWSRADEDSAIENVNELITFAAEYDREHAEGTGSLTDWLQMISLVSDQDAVDPEVGAVTLMTLHAAKGLEFDRVFIAGVEDGLLPHERSRAPGGDLEEERRLFFVGMTRARKILTVTSARWREFRGMTKRTSRSVFLTELPKDNVIRLNIGEDGCPVEGGRDGEPDVCSSEFAEWRQGQLLRHPSYGVGRLMWVQPRGGRTHAGVHFAAYGEKTFILEMAKLEPVDMDW